MNPFQLIPKEEEDVFGGLAPLAKPPQMPALPPTTAPIAPKQPLGPIAPLPQTKLPGMPESVSIPELEGYLGKQKESLNEYGPEAQMELQDETLDERNSLGSRATSGLKGFADSIMQGVAEAGNPGWQKQYEDRQDALAKERMDTLKSAGQANMQRAQSNMSIDAMNPKSELSKSKQQTYAPLFEKLGYPPDALAGMSAANIDNSLQLMTTYGGKEIEAQIKQNDLEIERARLAAAMGKQSSDERIAQENQKIQAAKELAGRGTENRSIGGIPIPFTKKPTEASELGTKFLSDKLGAAQQFKTEEEAAAAGLQDGTPVVIGGVKGTWRNE